MIAVLEDFSGDDSSEEECCFAVDSPWRFWLRRDYESKLKGGKVTVK